MLVGVVKEIKPKENRVAILLCGKYARSCFTYLD